MTRRALLRRAVAAALLVSSAIGPALFWASRAFDPLIFGVNALAAVAGMVWLHIRWSAAERRALTPEKAKDIFS